MAKKSKSPSRPATSRSKPVIKPVVARKPMQTIKPSPVKVASPKKTNTTRDTDDFDDGVKMPLTTKQKVAVGVGAATALGVGAYAASKLFKRGKKRRNQTQSLKAKIIRKTLRIRNIQLDRKLLKEQLKGI